MAAEFTESNGTYSLGRAGQHLLMSSLQSWVSRRDLSGGVWSGSVRNMEALMSYKVEKKVLLADKDALKQGSDPGKCKRTKTVSMLNITSLLLGCGDQEKDPGR